MPATAERRDLNGDMAQLGDHMRLILDRDARISSPARSGNGTLAPYRLVADVA